MSLLLTTHLFWKKEFEACLTSRKRINEQFIALNDLSQRMQPELQPQPGLLNGHADTAHGHHANGAMVFGDSVPKSVIEHVDTYRNPHGYTKTTLSRATGENQYALGRMLGLEVSDHLRPPSPYSVTRRHQEGETDLQCGRY